MWPHRPGGTKRFSRGKKSMIKQPRLKTRLALLALSVLLGAGILMYQPSSRAGAPPTASPDKAVVLDYADQISRLVQNGKIDELEHLNLPATPAQVSKLKDWTSEYLTQV